MNEFPEIQSRTSKRRSATLHNKLLKEQPAPNGPHYFVLSRNESVTMSKVSPFTISKAVEQNGGDNVEIKKLRDGKILIKAPTVKQAVKRN